MIKNSSSIFLNFHADCQKPLAYLDKYYILPKNIFVNVPLSFDNNKLQLINPSNLPFNFEWESIKIPEEKHIEFFPKTGLVPPKSSLEISFKMIYYSIVKIDDIFKCKINELDVPIGVNVRGTVTGLDISYELTDESFHFFNQSKFESMTINSSSINSLARKSSFKDPRRLINHDSIHFNKTLNIFDFKNLKVNQSHSVSFVVKNLSGISTNFNFESKNFNPGIIKDVKYNIKYNDRIELKNTKERESNGFNNTQMTQNSNMTHHTFNLKKNMQHTKYQKKTISRMILNDAHELINFTSVKGSEFTKMRQVEKDAVLYLSSKKGVAIIIEPKEGKLEPYSDLLVNVTIYNECVGDFEDELISKIKGLPERRFPINLRIRGNPLQLPLFQPGINYNESPPNLNMGYASANVSDIEKSFKVINTGTNLIDLKWKIFDYEDILNPKQDIFKISITSNKKKEQYSIIFSPNKPEPVEKSKYFEIIPSDILIQPKGTQDFNVKFKTDCMGLQSCLLVAYPKFLNDERSTNVNLSELALKVNAFGVKPNLVIDKKMNFEGKYIFRFYLHSFGISPRPRRSIILINKEKINFVIRLNLDGPFQIMNYEPKESCLNQDGLLFNVVPNSNLKVEISAKVPDSKNLKEWPITLVNEKNGKMSVTFENGEIMEYYLRSVFKRPRISLSTTGNDSVEGPNMIDFGKVNCESFKKASMYLKNITEVETDWKINYINFIPKAKDEYGFGTTTLGEKEDMEMCDDPDMFMFNLTNGRIEGPSIMLTNIPLGPGLPKVQNENTKRFTPLKIDIIFKPKKNIFYKCRYIISTSTGNSIDFILKGSGSYFEEMIKN